MIAITSAESYLAQSVARRILQQQQELGNVQLRLLTRDPSRCEELKRLGAQVIQVNYQEQEIQEAIKQCQWLLVIPEHEETRVQATENILKAANKAVVRNVIILSTIAAADGQGKMLQEYRRIEQCAQTQLQNNWMILRKDWLHQDFLLLSGWIEENRQLPLPICRDNKLVPINIQDINEAIIQLITKNQNQVQPVIDDRFNRQTLTLTGPQAVNGEEIVEELKKGIQRGEDIMFQEVQRKQFEEYLKELSKSRQYAQKVQAQERAMAQGAGRSRQQLGIPLPPNRVEIETILEYFDWVKLGKDERVSQDLRKIIGQDGQRLRQFFQDHSDHFKPRA